MRVIDPIRLAADDNEHQDGDNGGLAVQEAKPALKRPARYRVLMYNDD